MATGIYKITNKATNKFYIGSAVNTVNRWSLHKNKLKSNSHPNKHLQNAWDKYGQENFIFEIIEECSREDLIVTEQKYLDILKPWDNNIGYNIAKVAGNTLGCYHTDESKELISKNNKASSPEVKQKMKDYWSNSENRRHISEARKTHLSKEENRQAISRAIKNHYKNNPDKRPVGNKNPSYGKKYRNKEVERIDVETGEIKEYLSIRDTAKDGFQSSTVGKVCKGQLITHKGYYWKYKEV
jgi:group I intron endonuclease